MATKRMFSHQVVSSDRFWEMPLSSQALYFHLGMHADVRGFVNPRGVLRLINAQPDDLKVLEAKGFVIPFESGVVVITHWNANNNVRETHEASSHYVEELHHLMLSEEGKYSLQENYSSTTVELPQRSVEISRDEISIGESTPTLNEIDCSKRKYITNSILQEIADKYEVPLGFVENCWDTAQNWLDAKGKVQKDYKAFLSNWVKRERADWFIKNKKLQGVQNAGTAVFTHLRK